MCVRVVYCVLWWCIIGWYTVLVGRCSVCARVYLFRGREIIISST